MNEQLDRKKKSELQVNALLQDLPLRHAPITLESRVFRELEQRAARPWWRRGFKHWPNGGRAAFVAICSVIIGYTIMDGSWSIVGARTLNAAGAWSLSWAHPVVAAIASAGEFATLLVHIIPATWLYGGVAACAMLYAALFGLSATAYRSLYLRPSMAGDHS